MSDIATKFFDFTKGADFALDAAILSDDDGLLTSVLISLFTDRRARKDDVLPNADQGSLTRAAGGRMNLINSLATKSAVTSG
jgi:phage gp46-like protein